MTHPTTEHHFAPTADVTGLSLPLLWFVSFGAMIIWPAAAIGGGVAIDLFERPDDAALLFGGVTLFLALPLGFLQGVPEVVFAWMIASVWLAALLFPPWRWVAGRQGARQRCIQVVVGQSIFSLVQAALGAAMLFGKSV